MTKMYRCIHCGAIGHDIIYDVYAASRNEVFTDSRTGQVIRVISRPPDKYDLEYPIWTKCSKCNADLFGSAKQYIIEVE